MFKIQVKNLQGNLENHYWLNAIEDDFIQFLPSNLAVPKENFFPPNGNIYKFSKADQIQLEAYLKLHEDNTLKLDVDGEISVIRLDPAQIKVGIIRVNDFDIAKAHREADFADLTPVFVAVPTLEQLDFGQVDANGATILEGGYTITASHELTQAYSQNIFTYTGIALAGYPYDAQGVFVGNN